MGLQRVDEEKRKKDESWARYTDENPRGAGNTMNRGQTAIEFDNRSTTS